MIFCFFSIYDSSPLVLAQHSEVGTLALSVKVLALISLGTVCCIWTLNCWLWHSPEVADFLGSRVNKIVTLTKSICSTCLIKTPSNYKLAGSFQSDLEALIATDGSVSQAAAFQDIWPCLLWRLRICLKVLRVLHTGKRLIGLIQSSSSSASIILSHIKILLCKLKHSLITVHWTLAGKIDNSVIGHFKLSCYLWWSIACGHRFDLGHSRLLLTLNCTWVNSLRSWALLQISTLTLLHAAIELILERQVVALLPWLGNLILTRCRPLRFLGAFRFARNHLVDIYHEVVVVHDYSLSAIMRLLSWTQRFLKLLVILLLGLGTSGKEIGFLFLGWGSYLTFSFNIACIQAVVHHVEDFTDPLWLLLIVLCLAILGHIIPSEPPFLARCIDWRSLTIKLFFHIFFYVFTVSISKNVVDVSLNRILDYRRLNFFLLWLLSLYFLIWWSDKI